ncbi:AbrB/MazE/SpoVT family DNA-binding domain-containing protein [Gemmobacter lutimaris]|jgi:antitoxin MazE|uniref:AbrB/MazE/SpoVT family DNA-binding domain-containing protein n=1 Tax=Gemmobacter lutimaris TaxID=2306023 RepID=A0A398BQQ4_9RHOB|nr:AbrB/MazE/SpoVT family DNA-binding domain-containing protein [Gemmobacter lutimaris]RID90230.1 AbrB/MazE/SpoVT family DNA-binding domain-containing protein [Gemmobacter lutimaris]
MKVVRWGNSLAVRLPVKLVRELGLVEGDRIDLIREHDVLRVHRLPRTHEVLDSLRKFRCRLPASQRLGRDDAQRR